MVCLFALQLTVELCCVHMAMLESGSASLGGTVLLVSELFVYVSDTPFATVTLMNVSW